MTNEQLIAHFGPRTIYRFDGTVDELEQLQTSTENSYGYVISQELIYFVAENPVTDSRATVVAQ